MIIEAFNTSSTSISVTWTAPLSPNGIIRQYIVSYVSSDGSCDGVKMLPATDGDATMATLTDLMIFTSYNISVRAVTVDLGDPSELVVVTTDEDCEFSAKS